MNEAGMGKKIPEWRGGRMGVCVHAGAVCSSHERREVLNTDTSNTDTGAHKEPLLPLAPLTNMEAAFYSQYKIMSSYRGDKISAGKNTIYSIGNHPTNLNASFWHTSRQMTRR